MINRSDSPTVPRDDLLQLDQQLCFAVYSTAHAFTRFYRPLLEKLGITYPQYLVLLVLWEAEDQPVGVIGDRLKLDSGTLTPLLKRLEKLGIVTRTRSATDERQLLVGLTDKGREMEATARDFPGRILTASACAVEEITGMRDALFDLREKLDAATRASSGGAEGQ